MFQKFNFSTDYINTDNTTMIRHLLVAGLKTVNLSTPKVPSHHPPRRSAERR